MNTLGGLHPDTVETNLTGSIRDFWRVLSADNQVLNWNGEVSPVVHQLDHFQKELLVLSDKVIEQDHSLTTLFAAKDMTARPQDKLWQLLPATRCLFDCSDSVRFDEE